MIFTETAVPGAHLVELQKLEDERGFFARAWCQHEFEEHHLNPRLAQCNVSYNARRGTLRGMHLQAAPSAEAKLIRCTRGALYDVLIDLRPASSAYLRWVGVTLTEDNYRMLYVPEGCAHGFLTLADRTEVFYQMTEFYVPDAGRGVRWDDAAFGIDWPEPVQVISDRDRTYPDFQPEGLSA